MWIDYDRSKRAVERNLNALRDYVLKGYFTITDDFKFDSDFSSRFELSGSFVQMGGNSSGSCLLIKKLSDEQDQIEWIASMIESIQKLGKKEQEVILYHYLKGISLSALKIGIDSPYPKKISKANERNKDAIEKLMIYFDDCLIPYHGDLNNIKIIKKVGAINFVKKNKGSSQVVE